MRLLSWNVNGLRSCLGKGFQASIAEANADIVALQETRLGRDSAPPAGIAGYPWMQFHGAERPGYSGTGILSRVEPLRVEFDFGREDLPREGRVFAAEFSGFHLVNAYVPNSQDGLRRLDHRVGEWEPALRAYLCKLDATKPVVYCGDLNVAHEEIDIARPAANRTSPGFTDEERAAMSELLRCGFCDAFRTLHPDAREAYTWWSYRARARERNVGWRLDYFIVSKRLIPSITGVSILASVGGSDHCPVVLDLAELP